MGTQLSAEKEHSPHFLACLKSIFFLMSPVNSEMTDAHVVNCDICSELVPRAGSGAVSKWVICACDSLVDFGAV